MAFLGGTLGAIYNTLTGIFLVNFDLGQFSIDMNGVVNYSINVFKGGCITLGLKHIYDRFLRHKPNDPDQNKGGNP